MAKFNELSFLTRVGVMMAVGAAIFAGAWYGPVPGLATMRAANDASIVRLKAQQADNARLKPYEGQLKEIELQIDSLQRQMERQKQIVPDQKSADQFIRDLQSDAVQAGVEIRSYSAKPVAQKQYYSEVPFDVEIDGPYFAMLNFFERVGTMERIVNIDGLRMSGIGSKAPPAVKRKYDYAPGETVTVACTAKTFYSQGSGTKPAGTGEAQPAAATKPAS
ncbi:MAG: type 4a pilus biogenesis protein PilO [Terriglobales bacterium]